MVFSSPFLTEHPCKSSHGGSLARPHVHGARRRRRRRPGEASGGAPLALQGAESAMLPADFAAASQVAPRESVIACQYSSRRAQQQLYSYVSLSTFSEDLYVVTRRLAPGCSPGRRDAAVGLRAGADGGGRGAGRPADLVALGLRRRAGGGASRARVHAIRADRRRQRGPWGSGKDAKLAQKLGQLQPFTAVFPQECMGQPASFGPT